MPRTSPGLLLALSVLLTTGGCAFFQQPPAASPPPGPPPSAAPSSAAASPSPSPSKTKAPRNDLRRMPLKRTLRAGKVTVDVSYSSAVPVDQWRPGDNKPLQITLTARNVAKPGQKLYLTRLTGNLAPADDTGPLDAPRPLSDTTNISPGFIVTPPNRYNQNFVVPALDDATTTLTMYFTYEFVIEVNRTTTNRDYAKRSFDDTVVISLA